MEGEYNPYKFAKSQGFSDADAYQLDKAGADATNIRRVAIAKWGEDEAALKRGDKPKPKPKPDEPALEPDEAKGFGDYLCPKCKVTHKAGSKVHAAHLKLL